MNPVFITIDFSRQYEDCLHPVPSFLFFWVSLKRNLKMGAKPYVSRPYVMERLGLAVRNELDRPARNLKRS